MVRLVPIEKHPMVLLVNMHLIKETVTWLGPGQFQMSIGTNGTIGTNAKASYSNGSIGEYASH